MKLRQIIKEQDNNEPVLGVRAFEQEQFIDLLNNKCRHNFNFIKTNPKKTLYRGFGAGKTIKEMGDYAYLNSTVRTRTSANTENYYTLMFDNFPEWKDYPKRSKSLICTNVLAKAHNYGKVYIVIPFDGTKLASAPQGDIWNAFKESLSQQWGIYNLKEFNNTLFRILTSVNIKADIETYDEFLAALKTLREPTPERRKLIDELKKSNNDTGFSEKYYLIKDLIASDNVLRLRKIFNPRNNNIDIIEVDEIKNSFVGNEIWFAGEAMVFNSVYGKEIFGIDWEMER